MASAPTPRAAPRRRAAQYLRASTENQRYSTENQAAALARYAADRDFDIVRTYADDGISGVSLRRRKGLQNLLADVLGGQADFEAVLVHDVSRWGRFQNPDQSAHYEFLCAEAGVRIEYCAELFDNDGSIASTLLKGLKRAMAAEDSRDLSVKVSAGQLALLRKGYWLGAFPGYGLRRQMIDRSGRPVMVLEAGERKALQDCHNILVPGPAEEVARVLRIYRLYVGGMTRAAIVRRLSAEGLTGEAGRAWTNNTVTQLLTNPKYIGDLVAGRVKRRLGGSTVKVDPTAWIRKRRAFEGIVPRSLFRAAQAIYARRMQRHSRQALIDAAARVYAVHGRLTFELIAATPGLPKVSTFQSAFGGLSKLCAAIGHPNGRPVSRRAVRISPDEALRRLADLYQACGHLNAALINQAEDLPSASHYRTRFGSLGNAFAQVGFVPFPPSQRNSPVSRARLAAAEARARQWRAGNRLDSPAGPDADGHAPPATD
jgi:DNA invertase Pin-like site-specific DNA recombinase